MNRSGFADPGDDPLASEAVRLYRRYQTEVVEGLVLCPWAERARLQGRVRERVALGPELDLELTLAELETLAEDSKMEIGLLLFPRVRVAPNVFERFVSSVSARDAERRELGTAPFALAAFHPRAKADFTTAERLIPFLRRTPDPTIQVVRQSSLERVRDGFNEGTHFVDIHALATLGQNRDETLPLRERIARANERTVQAFGVSKLERRFQEIEDDRAASYERLGNV